MRSLYSGILLCVFALLQVGCSNLPNGGNGDANVANVGQEAGYADATTAFNEGNKFLDEGNIEKAVDAYAQAVKLDPDMADAYFQMGIAYSLNEKRSQEEGEITEVIPGEKKVKEKKSNSDLAFEKAVAAYKKQTNADSKNDVAFFNLGRALNKLDEDNDAARALRDAVRLKPDNAEYQTELGAILIKLAKYGEAIGALKKALELDPENSKAIELLERAEAGQKRVGYVPIKKESSDDKKSDANDDAETNGDDSKDGDDKNQSDDKGKDEKKNADDKKVVKPPPPTTKKPQTQLPKRQN